MNTKGRRAADRRRERQSSKSSKGGDGVDESAGTSPGQIDAMSDSDIETNAGGDSDLPLVSEVREVDPTGPGQTRDARARKARSPSHVTDDDQDPEASFVKAVAQERGDRKGGRAERGETTVVKPPAVDRPPRRGGRVIVLEGADQGGEADIDTNPCMIGRTAKAEIGLTDPTVSLRHLELRWDDENGFAIVDLGSTSGTLVNGKVVAGETALSHGDIIALGKTELRFVRGDKVPQARPEPEPEPEPDAPQQEPTEQLPTREATRTKQGTMLPPLAPTARVVETRQKIRKAAARVIGVSMALLVVALVGKLVHDKFFTDSAPAQIRAQVAELLANGRNRLRAQDVEGAKAAAETVLALDPKSDDAMSLVRMADTEAEARDAVQLALRLGDEERDQEASQILKRVPDSSVFAPTRDRLRRTLDERDHVRSRRQLESLLDQGRAKEALEAALRYVATWPEDEDGKTLLQRAQAIQAVAPKNPGLSAARAAFAAGDVAKARAIASENGLKSYVRDVDDFQSSLAKGKAALSRFDETAANNLDVAFRLLSVLGGDASAPIFAEVRKPYAKALLVSGTAKLDKAPCSAARDLYKAARVTPDDQSVQAGLRTLDAMAVAALDRARAAKNQDVDRAAAIAREGLCLAKTGSRTADELKAMSRL